MEFVFDLAVTLLSLAIVALHIRAVRTHFHSESTPPSAKIVAAVTVASVIAFLALTWMLPQPAWAQVLGLVVEVLSAMLFLSAIRASKEHKLRFVYDPTHPHSLVETGPYRVIRHPFYVSYLLFWTGWAIAVWSPWALLTVVLLLALYVVAARREESYFAASPLAPKYAEYKARTGFFLPGLG